MHNCMQGDEVGKQRQKGRELPGIEALSFTMLVVLVSRQPAMVANGVSPSSLLYFCYDIFLLYFFVPPINGVPVSLQWLHGGVVYASGAAGGDE